MQLLRKTRDGGRDGAVALAAGCGLALCIPLLAGHVALSSEPGEPLQPVPLVQSPDTEKLLLGKRLFSDTRLSGDGTVSCSSCHDLARGGANSSARSVGTSGVLTTVNTPTIFNSSLNFRQFWDGRADTLQAQAYMALHNQAILNTDWRRTLPALNGDTVLQRAFARLYPDGVTRRNVVETLVVYENSLITPNARFDKYLRGDKSAIDADELKGYTLFKSYGCVACHQGVNVGGNMFEVLGVVGMPGEYFTSRGNVTEADLGRYNVTHRDGDKYMFKVPSLRNVALTAPYLHDGSVPDLEQAVRIMFKYQLGRNPEPRDIALIVKFLGTLTGEYEGKPLDDNGSARH